MPIYDIAGLKVRIDGCKGRTLKQAVPYLSSDQSESENADIVINITEKQINSAIAEHPELNAEDWDYMLSGSSFYTQLTKYGGILLHSSCVVVDGVAYAFSADSGTGKSTHTSLWLKHFKDRAHMLNDDKPALRMIDGRAYACGTPWSGKHDYSTPETAPLGAICFIERGDENRIEKIAGANAIFDIFAQTVRNLNEEAMNNVFDILDEMLKVVPIYRLYCNISDEAVEVAYNAMKRSKDEFE